MLGHAIDEPDIKSALESFGIDIGVEIKLPEDEYTAYLERKADGYCFVFTDEAMFLNISDQRVGEGPLFFSGVFFYAEGKDGYSRYKGDLPVGLDFSFTRNEILNGLGQPTAQRMRDDGSIIGDRWELPNYFVSVTYSKNNNNPVLVSLFVPRH